MRSDDSGTAAIEGERPALVPPGLYDVAFNHYETAVMFGRAAKLVLQFRIVTMGDHFESKLNRFYNITRLIGRPAREGRFKVGYHSDFLREYATLFGVPARLDRIPMSNFGKHIFIAKVRTVDKGSQQRKIPEALHYSVISELKGIKD